MKRRTCVMKVSWNGYLYECDELLLRCISVCSSGLFGRALLILTATTQLFIWGKLAFHHNFDPVGMFFPFLSSFCALSFVPRSYSAGLLIGSLTLLLPLLFLILTTPSSLSSVMWHFSCHLSISLSLHCALVFHHVPSPSHHPFTQMWMHL